MKRGSLFFIGLISAIATIVSLNFAFGRQGFYNDYYPYHHRYYHHYYYDRHDDGYRNRDRIDERKPQADSTNSNY